MAEIDNVIDACKRKEDLLATKRKRESKMTPIFSVEVFVMIRCEAVKQRADNLFDIYANLAK